MLSLSLRSQDDPASPGIGAVKPPATHRPIHMLLVLVFALGLGAAVAEAQTGVDGHYRSPRATVRTLFAAVSIARINPPAISAAITCLDLGDRPVTAPESALLANQLEAVLRARDLDDALIPDVADGTVYVFPEWHGLRMAMQRQPDGRWLFDRETTALIPRLFAEAQARLQEKNKAAAELNVSPLYASARATVRTMVDAYRRQDYPRLRQAMDLGEVPLVAREEVGNLLAGKLKQVLMRQRRMILQEIPDSNFSDPYVWLSHPAGVVELVRLPSDPRKGEWVFSRDTVRSLDQLYVAFEDRPYNADIVTAGVIEYLPSPWTEPALWLRSHLPSWLRKSVLSAGSFTLEVYELAGYLLVPLVAWAVHRLAVWLLSSGLRRALALYGWDLRRAHIAGRLWPAGLLAAALFVHWATLLLISDRVVLVPILWLLNPLIWMLVLWAAFRMIDLVSDVIEVHVAARMRGADFGRMLWPVVSLVLKIALLVATIFHLMEIFDWDLTAVLTGLGIGGLAVALGAQDALKNLFGSFTLVADRPFLVGESVKIGGHEVGEVEVVGLRSTRIRTADDTLLIVPNSSLTDTEITNYGRRRYRRFSTRFTVAYATPLDKVLALQTRTRELIRQHAQTRKQQYEVALEDFAANGIRILVDVHFEVATREEEIDARDQLILDILRLARELEVELA